MLEINASSFLGAATTLTRIHQIFAGISSARDELLIPTSVAMIVPPLENFEAQADLLGANLAVVASRRLRAALSASPCQLTVGTATQTLNEVESRFADFLVEIQMFTLNSHESIYLQAADDLIEIDGFSTTFPTAAFEVEEAAKCIAFGRFTASVFHSMRMLEISIKALAKRLSIEDPTKPAEKNWAVILKAIRNRIDELWPSNNRMPGSEGVAFEAMYSHLDAVRNPWRNATMHVETIYAPHEALHILRCSAYFLRLLSALSDEQGNQPPSPDLLDLGEPSV